MRKIIFLIGLISTSVYGSTDFENCVLDAVSVVSSQDTATQINQRCSSLKNEKKPSLGAISKRIKAERKSQWDRFVITPHRRNYILPYTHTSKLNRKAYEFTGDWADEAKQYEAKLQLSIKVPLNHKDLFRDNDALYLGFTLQSWWQVYASEISAPFRETNYQPELFYLTGLDWHPMGGNTGLVLGIEHQSNGRTQRLSRSWNRIYSSFLYEKGDFALSFRPWYRLKEDKKKEPLDSEGDDNPDIEAYMGHFELKTIYRSKEHEYGVMWRNNLRSDNKGAIELDWSFPLYGHLKGFVQYFNGYGESLVDYNISQQRIGIGILLTDIL